MATFKGNCQHCGEETFVGQYNPDPKCHVCKSSLRKKAVKSSGVSMKKVKEDSEVILPTGKQNKKFVA